MKNPIVTITMENGKVIKRNCTRTWPEHGGQLRQPR